MKNQIWQKLSQTPRLSRKDIFIFVIPVILWIAAVHSRNHLIQTRCASEPEACVKEHIFEIDQKFMQTENGVADGHSFTTQYLAGGLTLVVPMAWTVYQFYSGAIVASAVSEILITDLTLYFQASAWNGLATELFRLSAQRPRPFVYSNPAHFGANPQNYTSFVSGHTSFTSTAGFTLFFTLLGRAAPTVILALAAVSGGILIPLTGWFRVLSGRHFLTDVFFAALSGAIIAFWIAWIHRKKFKSK